MEEFTRTLLLINNEEFQKLTNIHVLIVGIGGVGGYALEALVRFGIQKITIVDKDNIDITNLNRQIITNHHNIGNSKVKEAILRAKSINPVIDINSYEIFLNEANFNEIDDNYDYIIDACDTVTTKLLLIKYSIQKNIPIISSMGTGNRFDPTKLKITNIWQTNNDPLAKTMRKLLKENHISKKIPVVTSDELPVKTHTRKPGSTSLVPSVAGIYCAYYVIKNQKSNLD